MHYDYIIRFASDFIFIIPAIYLYAVETDEKSISNGGEW
jgi:hypothetical protein